MIISYYFAYCSTSTCKYDRTNCYEVPRRTHQLRTTTIVSSMLQRNTLLLLSVHYFYTY